MIRTGTLDPGPNQVRTTTIQTLNIYGCLTQTEIYDYGASPPTRAYDSTYLHQENPA